MFLYLMKKTDELEESNLNSYSPTLITTYSHKAMGFISSIERFLYLLLAVLIIFAVLVLFETAAIKGYIKFLSDDTYDIVLSVIAFTTIGIMVFLLRTIIKTRKRLDNWAFMFAKNSIGTSLSISLSKAGKRDLLNAIISSV